jgi:GT2 family glycosyltransferase/peptidoglycan/xylan/chitin deacetylase (PgdA/CDA1 family)
LSTQESNSTARRLFASAIVATWKRPALLGDTLESLTRQSYSEMEIIVVCDGEDAEVRSMAAAFQSTQPIRWIFHAENRGLAAARNSGVHEALGDVVIFFDDDIVADPECIAAHMAHHLAAAEGRTQVVCGDNAEDAQRPLATFIDQCLFESWNQTRADGTAMLSSSEVDTKSDEMQRSTWCGLNCSIRRDLFLRHDGFNEEFRTADEEMEFGERLYLAGFEFLFEPRARLLHRNAKELAAYNRSAWRARGVLDTKRVFDLHQRTAQTSQLAAMNHGYLANRIAARGAWRFSAPLLSVSNLLQRAANRTQWHPLFGAWGRIAQAGEYWTGAKSAGCTLPQLKSVIGATKRAMMLHSICEPLSSEEASYYIEPRRFQRLMKWFQFAGYKTATLDQWLRNEIADNQVLLTFDDAYDDLYEELLPLVIERRYTPVIFLVADRIGYSNVWDQADGLRARNLLSLAQIREMQKYGVEFGSHTLSHPWLPKVSHAQLQSEVADSKHRLEDLLGVEITSFAYPYGGVDQRVRSAVANAGYKLAFTIANGANWWNDPLCQRRADINSFTSMLDFAAKLKNGRGISDSLSARMRNLQQNVPTRGLRGLVRGLRAAGRNARQVTSAERKNILKTQKQR